MPLAPQHFSAICDELAVCLLGCPLTDAAVVSLYVTALIVFQTIKECLLGYRILAFLLPIE